MTGVVQSRRRWLVASAVTLVATGLSGCAARGEAQADEASDLTARFGVIIATEQDLGRPLVAKVGERIEFRLASRAGRGQRIRLGSVVTPTLVQDGPVRYVDDTQQQMRDGATNLEIWRFRAVAAGAVTVAFDLRREWETMGPAPESLRFNVSVS